MTGTTIRTILVVATSLNTALLATDITGFASPTLDMVYKVASVVLNFVVVACATYFNNDYTDTAKIFTDEMRAVKKEVVYDTDELPAGYFEKGGGDDDDSE